MTTSQLDAANSAAADLVERFLEASMVPDPEAAARCVSPELVITFTGGRIFHHPRESTAFNATRYAWVKKRRERSDVAPGDGETIVYNIGTLYGEWPGRRFGRLALGSTIFLRFVRLPQGGDRGEPSSG